MRVEGMKDFKHCSDTIKCWIRTLGVHTLTSGNMMIIVLCTGAYNGFTLECIGVVLNDWSISYRLTHCSSGQGKIGSDDLTFRSTAQLDPS